MPGIPAIFQLGLTTRHNILETFRLEAECTCRRGRKGSFAEFLFGTRVLLGYLMVKLKMLLGIFFCTFDQRVTIIRLHIIKNPNSYLQHTQSTVTTKIIVANSYLSVYGTLSWKMALRATS